MSVPHRLPAALLLLLAALAGPARAAPRPSQADPRAGYDVSAYWLDLRVEPAQQRISGTVVVEARVTAGPLAEFVLDLAEGLSVVAVARTAGPLAPEPDGSALDGSRPLPFRHRGDRLTCQLPEPAARGELLTIAVTYSGSPGAVNAFDGFHWSRTPSGAPWIATSCQTLGAFTWWPCKANFFHPEDKPERLLVDLTVPRGLTAVSNGRLVERRGAAHDQERFRWRHDYPLETYTVTLNVGPYVELAGTLQLAGLAEPVPYSYFVLPEDEAKARLQFADVPAILEAYSQAFGPWPFPGSKVGLVQTPFWGMEHSSAVAYGSSFPAWIAEHGGQDRFAARNQDFDYILVHELAHEWWGNAVSAADWGDFWLHEGFATYAEGVFVEGRDGREAADRYFAKVERSVPRRGSLYRGRGASSAEAYSGILYGKGAMVLNTLRHYLDDDAVWWAALREFQRRFRYGNATTDDFRGVLEELSGRDWSRFFAEWVHGDGAPRLRGSLARGEAGLVLEVENSPGGEAGFLVPLDIAWRDAAGEHGRRLWLEPGSSRLAIPAEGEVSEARVVHLERVLGKHDVRVR